MCRDNEALPSVSLENCRIIGYGATSSVYLMENGRVCKLYNPEFSPADAERDNRMAESAWQLGIRVPKPYGMVKAGSRIGVIREYGGGSSLAAILKEDPARYLDYLPVYVEELRRFHETKACSDAFVPAKDLYLEKLDRLHGTHWYAEEELQKLEALVRSVPDRDTLVYGDYHPNNILVQNGEFCFVDLGDICLGHPIFDFSMIANTHFIIPTVNPSYAEKYFTVPAERMLGLWEDLFRMSFSVSTAEEQARIRKQILAFAVLRQGLSPADGRVFPEQILQANTAAVKKRLLPDIDRIIGSVDW